MASINPDHFLIFLTKLEFEAADCEWDQGFIAGIKAAKDLIRHMAQMPEKV